MKTETEIINKTALDLNSIKAFVVLENKKVFDDVIPFYNKKFLNASLKEISEGVVGKFNYSILNIAEGGYNALKGQICEQIDEKIKTIVVIFADACVLENYAIDLAINRAAFSKFVNLNKSFVCSSEYLKIFNLNEIWKSDVFDAARANVVISPKTYLSDLEFAFQNVIVHNLMRGQVKFLSLTDVKIEFSADVGKNTIVSIGTTLLGETIVGENCNLENATLKNSFVGNNCAIKNAGIENCIIKSGNSVSGKDAKNFAKIINAVID